MVIVAVVVGKEMVKRKEERREGKGEKERKKGMLVSRRRGGPFLACVDFQVCVCKESEYCGCVGVVKA